MIGKLITLRVTHTSSTYIVRVTGIREEYLSGSYAVVSPTGEINEILSNNLRCRATLCLNDIPAVVGSWRMDEIKSLEVIE